MAKNDNLKLVTALFTFKGTNNDELCFKKGDIITITQTDDGGWWEGTLNEKTGWFPSNYVKECRSPDAGSLSSKSSPEKLSQESSPLHQRLNREIVLKDFLESERANVAELQGLVGNFLQPLELTNVLKKDEYKQLMNNIQEILDTHQRLLSNLEATIVQGPDARVGNLFITLAPRIKAVHMIYCNGHPQTVAIMDKYRDELNDFMEKSGAVTPGILVLTTGLSKPFRRLEKYPAMLQELERHTEKNHFDRGDTQRSVSVYRDIVEKCTYARKQKELALQILTSGVKGWEGEDLVTLGEILHVGAVTLAMGNDRRDRYFVLFPMTLLVLSTSPRMSSFVYEGKLPLTGIDIVPLEDTDLMKNSFEITGPMIESIIVTCSNHEEQQLWIDYLNQEQSTNGVTKSSSTTAILNTSNQLNGKQVQMMEQSLSPGNKLPWSVASLRPAAPIYSLKLFGKTDDSSRGRNTNERQFEDDAIILKVIEGYCMTVNARFTVNPEFTDNEMTNKGRDILENNKNLDAGDNRGLSENVETLKTQITDLQSQMMQLTRQLEEEKKSRLQLTGTVDILVKRRFNGIDNLVP